MVRVLVTGAAGLLGSQVLEKLPGAIGLDLKASSQDGRQIDICGNLGALETLPPVEGVVHLAGVSRVIDAERQPELCWRSNVDDFQQLLGQMAALEDPPWLAYSSSREVYGEPVALPVAESAPLAPVNVYGRSKVAAEGLAARYSESTGRPAQIIRFSNVYGHPRDYPTRVVPAFVSAAIRNQPIDIQGSGHLFDFTHVDDASHAMALAVRAAQEERQLPAIHVLPGEASSLDDLARQVAAATGTKLHIRRSPGRTFDVARFHGNPALMERELGMECRIRVAEGVAMLAKRFQEDLLCA